MIPPEKERVIAPEDDRMIWLLPNAVPPLEYGAVGTGAWPTSWLLFGPSGWFAHDGSLPPLAGDRLTQSETWPR